MEEIFKHENEDQTGGSDAELKSVKVMQEAGDMQVRSFNVLGKETRQSSSCTNDKVSKY